MGQAGELQPASPRTGIAKIHTPTLLQIGGLDINHNSEISIGRSPIGKSPLSTLFTRARDTVSLSLRTSAISWSETCVGFHIGCSKLSAIEHSTVARV